MWDATQDAQDARGRPAATLVSVASGDERHTKGHIKRGRERLGKWQRFLLLEAVEPTRLAEGKVKWSALIHRHAPNTTSVERDRRVATSLGSALSGLELAGLVRVTPARATAEARRRVVTYYELTARGLRRAEELLEHGGVTESTAKRRRRAKWSDPEVQAEVDEANRQRTEAEQLLLSVSIGMIAGLERRFGYPPKLGGGDEVEEAAKLYLLLARARLDQWLAPHAVGIRRGVERASAAMRDMQSKFGANADQIHDALQRTRATTEGLRSTLGDDDWRERTRQATDAIAAAVAEMARLQKDDLDEDPE